VKSKNTIVKIVKIRYKEGCTIYEYTCSDIMGNYINEIFHKLKIYVYNSIVLLLYYILYLIIVYIIYKCIIKC